MRLALALSFALFACGGGAKPAATTPVTPEPATATEEAAPAEPATEAAPADAAAPAAPAAAEAPAPAPPPAPTTRGPQKKASKSADPCAGGE